MEKIRDLPAIPTIEQITIGLYKLRFREISVFYSETLPIAYQYSTHLPVVRKNQDPYTNLVRNFHYEKLNIAARLRIPADEFDERFLSFVERHWSWKGNLSNNGRANSI